MSATTATPAETRALRDEGQERSTRNVSVEHVAAFLDLVRAKPAGADFTINDFRPQLDTLGVPDRARGGLMRRALAAGLIEALWITAGRYRVPASEPSTGRSAHHKRVQAYVRTDTS